MKYFYRYVLISCVLICIVLFNGCSSIPKTCINERTNKTIIRWGDYLISDGTFNGYEYRAQDLSLYKISKKANVQDMVSERLDSVQAQVFCMRLSTIIETFSEIQSLYSPGTIGRSIEYINQKTSMVKKAVWNPLFQTYGSKEFRAIYDSLMLTVPVSSRWTDSSSIETHK